MTTPATNTTLTQAASNVSSSGSDTTATTTTANLNGNSGNGSSNNNNNNNNNSNDDYKNDSTNKTQFWINQPSVLLDKNDMTDLWPMPLMSVEQKLNAITRLVLLLTILGFLITNNINIIFTGFITLAIFVMLYRTQYTLNTSSSSSSDSGSGSGSESSKKEGFVNSQMYNMLKPHLTTPTIQNPMMNVLLPEISYNPTRDEAAPAYNSEVEKEINHSTEGYVVLDFEPRNLTEAEKLRKKLFADLGDKYEFDDSMRMFYTNPSTTIPNDQKGFADFCCGDMISCKQGNEMACQRFNPVLGSVLN